jgi:hypothetical protein
MSHSIARAFIALCLAGACAAGQAVVAPYVQSFDDVPGAPLTLGAGTGANALGSGWEVDYGHPTLARVRCGDPAGFGMAGYSTAPLIGNLPACAVFDSAALGTVTTQALVLHVNYAASSLGQGIYLRFWLRENNDEPNLDDVVAVQDGMTAGDGVTSSGASSGAPGYGGFHEVRLLEWNTLSINGAWLELVYLIDDAYLLNNFGPLSAQATDLRVIWRHSDNAPLSGGDGLLLDYVRVDPNALGSGQAPQPGSAVMDMNGAFDRAGFPVVFGRPGPYFASAINGAGTLDMTFRGAPHQPIVLLMGPGNPGAAFYAGIGQVDIGISNPVLPYVPGGIVVVVDGSQPGFLSNFFDTGVNGVTTISLGMPFLPATGVIGTFQAAVFTGGLSVIKMSNAVELTIR